jgi:hypothetical protein
MVAPSAPSSRALGELEGARKEVRAALLVQPVLQTATQQVPVAARGAGAHRLVRHHRERLEAGGRVKARGLPVGAHHEAAAQRGRDVVGVALQLGRARQQVGVELEQVIRRHQPRDDRRRARPETAGERDLRGDAEGEAVRGVQVLEGAHAQVLASARQRQLALHRKAPGLPHFQLHVQRKRGRHAVEPRPQVRRGRRRADDTPTDHPGLPLRARRLPPHRGSPVRCCSPSRSAGP